ncbi:MAG: hypothetical protein C5B60_12450 [Chloroflexi bacterium]|nr:MAG: hypothetical protein C5B60_12450 [Chloroflexota bacterium]
MAIAYCASPLDVQQCLAFTRRFGLPVACRAGGHSYGGYSTTVGLVVDVDCPRQHLYFRRDPARSYADRGKLRWSDGSRVPPTQPGSTWSASAGHLWCQIRLLRPRSAGAGHSQSGELADQPPSFPRAWNRRHRAGCSRWSHQPCGFRCYRLCAPQLAVLSSIFRALERHRLLGGRPGQPAMAGRHLAADAAICQWRRLPELSRP